MTDGALFPRKIYFCSNGPKIGFFEFDDVYFWQADKHESFDSITFGFFLLYACSKREVYNIFAISQVKRE